MISVAHKCTNTDNGATDSNFDGCEAYDGNSWYCGRDDSREFNSTAMCCACGGGKKGNIIWEKFYQM